MHTGDDARFGSPEYGEGAHFLTRAGAAWLAGHDAALGGIDAVNIDDAADGERRAHSLLLAAGIPVVEHLTGLGPLPPAGTRFTAVPLRIEGGLLPQLRGLRPRPARLPPRAARGTGTTCVRRDDRPVLALGFDAGLHKAAAGRPDVVLVGLDRLYGRNWLNQRTEGG